MLRHCRNRAYRTAMTEHCPPIKLWFRRNHPTSFSLCVALSFSLPLSLCTASAGLSPTEHETIYRELQEPILVQLTNKRTIPGHSIEVSEKQIQIATSEGAGEIIYTFNLDEIKGFNIPGESYKTVIVEWIETGETEKAIALLELLYQQRVHLIPLLPASESHFFIYYVELILASNNPARAIAITEILRPQIDNPAALRALDDAILTSYNNLELYDKARPLAEKWLAERAPYGDSALGYYVLGTDKLRAEAYDEALELALQPIIFASPIATDKLGHCYAVAISAALGLREQDYAVTLYREMQQRELTWPTEDRTLEPFHTTILKEIEDA
ncbi:MAG: hypothetical protein NWR76_07945 [Opitutales bacterium]|nr:hypothetical protein [Opitutales bacterium]MDP5079852.1 hypothetical protein [Opitutales bacterium]